MLYVFWQEQRSEGRIFTMLTYEGVMTRRCHDEEPLFTHNIMDGVMAADECQSVSIKRKPRRPSSSFLTTHIYPEINTNNPHHQGTLDICEGLHKD